MLENMCTFCDSRCSGALSRPPRAARLLGRGSNNFAARPKRHQWLARSSPGAAALIGAQDYAAKRLRSADGEGDGGDGVVSRLHVAHEPQHALQHPDRVPALPRKRFWTFSTEHNGVYHSFDYRVCAGCECDGGCV